MKFARYADIDCLTTELDSSKPYCMLLHGYGANFEDLAGLMPYVDPSKNYNWIFPNGILEVPISPHVSGRAWFPIDMAALERQLQGGKTRVFSEFMPNGLVEARSKLVALIEQLELPAGHLVIGGFSQGAMLSAQVALELKDQVAGLIQLSSSLVDRSSSEEKCRRLKNLEVFQSHGCFDPILSLDGAQALKELWQSQNFALEYHEFQGGHEIPFPIMERLKAFLERRAQKIAS